MKAEDMFVEYRYCKVYTIIIEKGGKPSVWYSGKVGEVFHAILYYREGYSGPWPCFLIVDKAKLKTAMPTQLLTVAPEHCTILEEALHQVSHAALSNIYKTPK